MDLLTAICYRCRPSLFLHHPVHSYALATGLRLKVQRSGQCKSIGLGNPSAPLPVGHSIYPLILFPLTRGKCVVMHTVDRWVKSRTSLLLSVWQEQSRKMLGETNVVQQNLVNQSEPNTCWPHCSKKGRKEHGCVSCGEKETMKGKNVSETLPLKDIISNNLSSRARYNLQKKKKKVACVCRITGREIQLSRLAI